MKKSWLKKTMLTAMAITVMVAGFTGCGGRSDAAGSVVIAGSTSVQPLSEVLAAAYMDENMATVVEVQGGGSGQGIKSIETGIADIGSLSRNVKDEERGAIANETVIAMDGVAVIVNESCGVSDLTIEQIRQIYTGEVTNWSEVGGADAAITVVSREAGSGTRGAFTEITGILTKDDAGNETDNTTTNALVQPSTGSVKQTVVDTPNSIGYISMGSLDEKVTSVKAEGVEATPENVFSGTYLISRPFIYVTGENVSEEAQKYIDFALGETGQLLVKENGFIPVK